MSGAIENLQKLSVGGDDLSKVLLAMGYDAKDVGEALKSLNAPAGKSVGLISKMKTAFSGLAATLGMTAAQLGIAVGVIAALAGTVAVIAAVVDTTAEAREKLADLKSEFSVNETELASLNKELDNTNSRMAELNSKDKLTFTEQEELLNLQAQNAELERSIALLKEQQALKASEVHEQFVETANKALNTTSKYDAGQHSYRYATAKEQVYLDVSIYKENQKRLEELHEQYKNNISNETYQNAVNYLESENKRIKSFLLEQMQEFSDDVSGISYIDNPTTESQKAVNEYLGMYNDIQDAIMTAVGGDGSKKNALDRLTSTSFKDVTSELRNLGKQGKVAAETLQDERYQGFIDKLVEIGVIADDSAPSLEFLADYFNVSATAAKESAAGVSEAATSYDKLKESASGVIEELKMVTDAINAQGTGASISVDTYDALIAKSADYADCLEYQNGAIQLNSDKLAQLAKVRAEEEAATIAHGKAMAQAKYLENANQINKLREALDGVKLGPRVKILESSIAALEMENSELLTQVDRYNLLAASIGEAQSAYQHWLNSKNAAQKGDMFDGAIGAIGQINDVLNNTKSDMYGRIGRSDYQAAVDFIVPDHIDHDDADAVNKYLKDIGDMFTTDGSGNMTGLNIAGFCEKAVQEGLMVLDESGESYKIAGGKTMADFAEGLELSLPLVQAMFGELQEFGAKFDWADEAVKTIGDLAVSAVQAADEIKAAMSGTSISSMLDSVGAGGAVDLKVRPQVDTSELMSAGWENVGEGIATTFTSTFSNEVGDIAMNFTPIVTDGKGGFERVLTPDELQEYAEGVIAGVREDDLNLKIGSTFEGDGAINAAERAAEAAHVLQEAFYSGESKFGLDLDLSQFETAAEQIDHLDKTIGEVGAYKTTLSADSSEYEQANQIIEYCIRQRQFIEQPAVMKVDTSMVEGKMGDAISLLQQYVGISNELEVAKKVGISTTDLEASLAGVQAQIEAIDPNVKLSLGIDTTSTQDISSQIAAIDTERLTVDCKVNEDAIIGYKPDEKDAKVIYYVDDTAVDAYNPPDLERTVWYTYKARNSPPEDGIGGVNGTAHASGTAYAGGNWGTAPGGRTLMGELGPEIVVNPKTGRWYTVGDTGAQFVDIPRGSIVFNHKQAEALLKYGYVAGRGNAMAGGTAAVTGFIPVNKWTSGSVSSGGGSYSGSSSGGSSSSNSSSSSSSSKEDDYNPFEEQYKLHQHYLAMEAESLKDYLTWLEGAYKDAYANGYIEHDDFLKYEEECYDKSKDLFADYLNDVEHEISILEREVGKEGDIINLYIDMFNEVQKELNRAYDRGLTENDDYVQELLDKQFEYTDAIKDIQEESTDDAKSAVEDLVDYRIDMIKQELENEKDALNDRLDTLKDFYDKQKDMLKKTKEDEEYIEEQSEKRKEKARIEAELDQLKFNDSAWAQKRILELQEELAEADKDLEDFEKDRVYDTTMDFLDKMYEQQEEQIKTQIDAIDAKLNDPNALYNQALKDIQTNTEELYKAMVDYNNKYGDGNVETVKTMWDEARDSLNTYMSTFGQAYKQIMLVASTNYGMTGYASGTASATPGMHRVFENGDEYIFQSSDGKRYKMFKGGEKVLSSPATNFLYNFANNGREILSKIFTGLTEATNFRGVNSNQPIQVKMGDINVHGNASERTVSEIRRIQREETNDLLKRLAKLNK